MPRQLNAAEIKEIVSLRREDVTMDLIKEWFTAPDFTSQARFETNDRFRLPKDAYYNKESIDTTIGRYLVNMFVFPKRFLMEYGYVNKTLDSKTFESVEGAIGQYLLNDVITIDDYKEYVNNAEWLFMGCAYLLNSSMDRDVVVPINKVIKERDKLFDENAEAIAAKDNTVIDKIESTLTNMAKDELNKKGARSMDYYNAGVAKFGNAYKKTAIMVGAMKNPVTGKNDMIKSNFTDGLTKEEYGTASHSTTTGGYSRAEGTKISGYTNKKILNSTASMELDEAGSDCGTPYTISIEITDFNIPALTDRYIMEGGKAILLDGKKIKEYKGKTVQLRSPLFCHGDKICNKCAGELYYRLDTKNVGVHSSTMGGTILNLGMKAFHDATIKYYKPNLGDFIE